MKEVNLTVSAASGVEAVTKRELKRLGFAEPKAERGLMTVAGTVYDVARLNVFLRTADRVYFDVGSFQARTFDELFDGVKNVPWEEFCKKDTFVLINGKSLKSRLFALSACQKIIKKAIAERLCKKFNLRALPESGDKLAVVFDIFCDTVHLRIDTTGTGLHKRGYRDLVGVAPIRENLAAAYRKLDNWSLFAITEDTAFEKAFGKKADKNRKLYNSDKECKFYEYFGKRENHNGRKNSD